MHSTVDNRSRFLDAAAALFYKIGARARSQLAGGELGARALALRSDLMKLLGHQFGPSSVRPRLAEPAFPKDAGHFYYPHRVNRPLFGVATHRSMRPFSALPARADPRDREFLCDAHMRLCGQHPHDRCGSRHDAFASSEEPDDDSVTLATSA